MPIQFADNRIGLTDFDQLIQRILIEAGDSAEYQKRGFSMPQATPASHLYQLIERFSSK
jgi:hypothetical protein